MRFFNWLFRRSTKKTDQQAELDYRIALADVRRQATAMHKEVERCRNEAYRLELAGNHTAAVSKAAEAANSQKAYEAAQVTLQRCETMHAQARSQKMLKNLLTVCESMSANVMEQVDTAGAMQIQAQLQKTSAAMEEVQESMTAFQEGFEPNAEPAVRMAAGEDALAEIMAEHAPRPVQIQQPLIAAETRVDSSARDDADLISHAEWVQEKRRQLADLS